MPKLTETPGQLYTIKEAAALMRISYRSLHDKIKNGQVPVVRFGAGCVRIRPQDLENLYEKLLVKAD